MLKSLLVSAVMILLSQPVYAGNFYQLQAKPEYSTSSFSLSGLGAAVAGSSHQLNSYAGGGSHQYLNTLEIAPEKPKKENGTYYNSHSPAFAFIYQDNDYLDKGVVKYEVYQDALATVLLGAGASSAVMPGQTAAYTYGSTLSDGTYYLFSKAKDSKNVWGALTYVSTINIDTVAPTITFSALSGLTNKTWVMATGTRDASDTEVSVTSEGGSSAKCGVMDYGYQAPSLGWQCLTANLHEGTNILSAAGTDLAGNVSSAINRSVVVDLTPPAGTISINGGVATTDNKTVTLTLSASDANGVSSMRFSNDGAFPLDDNQDFVTYSTSHSWDLNVLPGIVSTNTVYAQFKDAAGNITRGMIAATITYDDTAQALKITDPNSGKDFITSNPRVALKGTVGTYLGSPDTRIVKVYYMINSGTKNYLSGYQAGKSTWTAPDVYLLPGINSIKVVGELANGAEVPPAYLGIKYADQYSGTTDDPTLIIDGAIDADKVILNRKRKDGAQPSEIINYDLSQDIIGERSKGKSSAKAE